MSRFDVIRAWKDPAFRLSQTERAPLPAHPVERELKAKGGHMKGFNRKHVRLWAYALPLATSLLLLPAKAAYGQEDCNVQIHPDCDPPYLDCKYACDEEGWSCRRSADTIDEFIECDLEFREHMAICQAQLDYCREMDPPGCSEPQNNTAESQNIAVNHSERPTLAICRDSGRQQRRGMS